jgi:hypothetical protein
LRLCFTQQNIKANKILATIARPTKLKKKIQISSSDKHQKITNGFDRDLHNLNNNKSKAHKLLKRVSKTYERMGDEEDKAEFDATCARFQDLRSDFKSIHRMKYDLSIEGIESGIKSNPRRFF